MDFASQETSSMGWHKGAKWQRRLSLGHVNAAGAQSLKEGFNIVGLESVYVGQRELVELIEGDETRAIADLNGCTNNGLEVHTNVLSKLGHLPGGLASRI